MSQYKAQQIVQAIGKIQEIKEQNHEVREALYDLSDGKPSLKSVFNEPPEDDLFNALVWRHRALMVQAEQLVVEGDTGNRHDKFLGDFETYEALSEQYAGKLEGLRQQDAPRVAANGNSGLRIALG